MKDILSNEQYCYKIHTLLMKSVLTPSPFIDNPPIWNTPPPPHFYKEILISSSMNFQKSHPLYK